MTSHISCDAHDYFEIVAMRRSQVLVTTYGNEKYQGTAFNIKVVNNEELLLIKDNKQTHQVALTEINKLQAIGNTIKAHNFSVQWPK